MNRRDLLRTGASTVGLTLLSSACGWWSIPSTRIARVLYVGVTLEFLTPLRDSLKRAGWIKGQNVYLESHTALGYEDKLPTLAAELVQAVPDVLFTDSTPAAIALKQATNGVPIVVVIGDPVGTGLVLNQPHPGGNITGLSSGIPGIRSKLVELIKNVVPTLVRLGYCFGDKTTPNLPTALAEVELAGRRSGVETFPLAAASFEDFAAAFESASRSGVNAVMVSTDVVTANHQTEIAALAVQHGLPTMCSRSDFVENGCLMSYGANRPALVARAATYVDRILRGAKPADLPVEGPTVFNLIVNRTTAHVLGLTIPPEFAGQVTQWVD